jgi:hypothetical protein
MASPSPRIVGLQAISKRRFKRMPRLFRLACRRIWSPQTRPVAQQSTGTSPKEIAMTAIRRKNKYVTPLLAAAVAAAALAVPSHASARPAPPDPSTDAPAPAYTAVFGGRTDEQFWGEATWLNPLSGLNLDRTSVAG